MSSNTCIWILQGWSCSCNQILELRLNGVKSGCHQVPLWYEPVDVNQDLILDANQTLMNSILFVSDLQEEVEENFRFEIWITILHKEVEE